MRRQAVRTLPPAADARAMWADTLLAAERSHVIRLVIWAVTSATLGTILVALIMGRRTVAPIVLGFAIQALAWGGAELLFALVRWRTLAMRDVSAATRLDRLTWFNAGLDVGIVVAGVAIAAMAWVNGRRLSGVGAGLGVLVQGLALLVINLTFASILARLI